MDDDGKETNRTYARLAGIDQDVIDHFSKRRKALLEYAEQHGVSNQQANKATRKHKDEPTYTELVEHWQEALKGFDLTPETLKAAQGNLDKVEHKSDAELLELLHENEAVFNDIDLVRVLGMEYAGKLDAAGLHARIEQFKQDNGLVLVNAERLADEDRGQTLARKHTEDRFCAPWMLQAEQAVVDIANRRANETQHHASQATVDRVIEDYQKAKGFQLSQEQLVAVNHICRGSGGVANLSGLAGTGKTTISELYKEALESEGPLPRCDHLLLPPSNRLTPQVDAQPEAGHRLVARAEGQARRDADLLADSCPPAHGHCSTATREANAHIQVHLRAGWHRCACRFWAFNAGDPHPSRSPRSIRIQCVPTCRSGALVAFTPYLLRDLGWGIQMIGLVVGAIILIGIIGASLSGREELDRYQQLKNKRRFSGQRLTPEEQEEMNRLSQKYWWW